MIDAHIAQLLTHLDFSLMCLKSLISYPTMCWDVMADSNLLKFMALTHLIHRDSFHNKPVLTEKIFASVM